VFLEAQFIVILNTKKLREKINALEAFVYKASRASKKVDVNFMLF